MNDGMIVVHRDRKRVQACAIGLALVMAAGSAVGGEDPPDGQLSDWPAMENLPPAATGPLGVAATRVRASRRLVKQAEARAQRILDGLTLEQKIGQMTQGEIQAVTPADIERYCLGSVLNGGGSWPNANKYSSPRVWRDLADAYWQAGMDGCGIPPLWGTDSVHGNSNVRGATLFPHNIGLGAANNPRLMKEIGRITARETRATGQPWVFAPVVAVARDDRWGRTYESYSEVPQHVTRLARPMIEGLQGNLGECSVAATMKHWIGDGGTTDGRDQGDTVVSEEDLINVHGLAYFEGLAAGALSVMPSFSSWNDEKLHGHRYLLTDVLKGRLGFSGHVISDWNGIGQVEDCVNTDCPQAFDAGIDLFMVPYDWEDFIAVTRQRVADGVIAVARIDDAVRRILRNKILLGLFEQRPSASRCAVDGELGADEHRAVARAAVRESLVLLKNDGGILPLARDARVVVSGKSADNIANQSGGWTLTWQGTDNVNTDFPGATSIYEGIRAVVPDAVLAEYPSSVDLSQYDVVIAVIGERPYAEGVGDIRGNQTLEHARRQPLDLVVLEMARTAGIPIVTVWVAGRPLYTNKELNRSDAFVAAWLPGSEGGGVADVLFATEDGEIHHDFGGKLSFSWPAEDCQTPVNAGGEAEPLFPYGFGLTYRDSVMLAQLDEASDPTGCSARDTGGDTATEPLEVFVQGATITPWQLFLGDPSNWDGQLVDLSDPGAETALLNVKAGPRVDSPTFQFGGISVSWGVGTEGLGPGQFYAQGGAPGGENLLAYRNAANAALVFHVRSSAPPTNVVRMRIDCGYPCFGELDLTPAYSAVSDGNWHELAIPLSCFAARGADFSRITAPFLVFTSGRWAADFATVRWEPEHAGNVTCDGVYEPLTPPAPSSPLAGHDMPTHVSRAPAAALGNRKP